MNSADLQLRVLEKLKVYWRLKAALLFLRPESGLIEDLPLEYREIPRVGYATSFLKGESLTDAVNELMQYFDSRLKNDVFLTLIAELEHFLSLILNAHGQNPEGTFGDLQKRVQAHFRIRGLEVLQLNEIRERRNSLIHHNGAVTARYVRSALPVYASSGGIVLNPDEISKTEITESYLSYIADVIIRYAKLFA